jgi:VIT1/CCC1 family predicted Fe2+/Mn2+ transporter
MLAESPPSSNRVLEPGDRVAEVLFGLIMVLTFTGSLSVAESGRADVRLMLIGALGCNIAWGIIDAILYLMGCLSERGKGIQALRSLHKAGTAEEAHRVIAGVLPPMVAAVVEPGEFEAMRRKLLLLPAPTGAARLKREDWLGAGAVFLWVFAITFPVAVPFIFMHDIAPAMRVSNAIAITLLFLTGWAYGRVVEYHPLVTGLCMVVLGSVLVTITMALGG